MFYTIISWFVCCLRNKAGGDECNNINIIIPDLIDNMYENPPPPNILTDQILNNLPELPPSPYELQILMPDLFDY